MMDISKSIEACLIKKKWGQNDLADAMNVSATTVSLVARRGSCNTDMLLKMAVAFDMPVSKFIAKGEQ